jgi:cytoskeletal protein RodZ
VCIYTIPNVRTMSTGNVDEPKKKKMSSEMKAGIGLVVVVVLVVAGIITLVVSLQNKAVKVTTEELTLIEPPVQGKHSYKYTKVLYRKSSTPNIPGLYIVTYNEHDAIIEIRIVG